MAQKLNLNRFKASGVYTVEVDESQNIALPLGTGRLVIGSSKKGPINTVVALNDLNSALAVYGEKDVKLESKGSYFQRTIEVALRRGPVFALNVLPVDDDLDTVNFATFNTESASFNSDLSAVAFTKPLSSFFNTQKLWYADEDQFNRTKNNALSDSDDNKILSVVNLGKRPVTIWVKIADLSGYDVTIKEYYKVTGGENATIPSYLHPDDIVADYMVELIAVEGDWTDNLRLSSDPIYRNYFNEEGLIISRINAFLNLREVRVLARVNGSIIPQFKSAEGDDIAIDRVLNRLFSQTELFAALDENKVELFDLEEDGGFDNETTASHRLDLAGHGYLELIAATESSYFIDEGYSTTSYASANAKIDVLGYTRPVSNEAVYMVFDGSVTGNETASCRYVTENGKKIIIANDASALYKAWYQGFILTGNGLYENNPLLVSGTTTPTAFIKVESGFTETISNVKRNYIKIKAYADVTLLNQDDIDDYTHSGDIILNDNTGVVTSTSLITFSGGNILPSAIRSKTGVAASLVVTASQTGTIAGGALTTITYSSALPASIRSKAVTIVTSAGVALPNGTVASNGLSVTLAANGTAGTYTNLRYECSLGTGAVNSLGTTLTLDAVQSNLTPADTIVVDLFKTGLTSADTADNEFVRISLDKYGTSGSRTRVYDYSQEIVSNDSSLGIIANKLSINTLELKSKTNTITTVNTIAGEAGTTTSASPVTTAYTANSSHRAVLTGADGFVKPNYYVKAQSSDTDLRPRFMKIVSVAETTVTEDGGTATTQPRINLTGITGSVADAGSGNGTVFTRTGSAAFDSAVWGATVTVKVGATSLGTGTIAGDGTNLTLSTATTAGNKTISIYRDGLTLTTQYTYQRLLVTTMVPSDKKILGVDLDVFNAGDTTASMVFIKGIKNYVGSTKGINLTGFTLRDAQLPNGTATRENDILEYLYTQTNIAKTLAEGIAVDFRYIIDTYQGSITSSSKYYLARLAADNGQCLAILNAPSFRQLELSTNPSFLDSTTQLVSPKWVAAGGNLDTNPTVLFSFPDEEVNGVPLGSYASYFMPNLIINDNGRNKSVPPAMYVANAYMNKYEAGRPFSIVAGKNGVLGDPEIVNLEYELSQEDRDFMEPAGFNMIVRRRGFGIMIFSNNTAYQKMNSALNNIHVREALATIEKDVERILFNFLFDFNDEITRLRIKTLVEGYLDRVKNAQGVASYRVVFDATNNGIEVISANTAIIDIFLDFPRGIHKFINRVTITRVGGGLSSQSTGFIPSF